MRKLLLLLLLTLSASAQPRTPREFFQLLPSQYFTVENGSKEAFLKRQVLVDDPANGYLSASGDAGQGGFVLALFKRSNGSYLVGLNSNGEMWDKYYILQYANGKWRDVSAQVIPEYSKDKAYRFPRQGTSVVVEQLRFEEGVPMPTGKKLYTLAWNRNKFVISR